MLAASQRAQELKFEVLVPIAGPEPTAIASFNYHQDHFGKIYGLEHRRRRRGRTPRCLGLRRRSGSRWRCSQRTAGPRRAGPPRSGPSCGRERRRAPGPSLFGADPATYRPHLLHAGEPRATTRPTATPTSSSSCCTRAATSRWPRWAPRCAIDFEGDQWTFFKPPPGRPRACSSASTSTRCSPTGRCPSRSPSSSRVGPHDDRRARRLVPARHRGDELPPRARQDARSSPRRSTVDGERLRYFHDAGLTSSTGEDYRGVFRLGARLLRRRAAALRRARALRRRPAADGRRAARARRASCCARHLARRPATNPFTRFGEHLARDLPGLLEGDRERLPRLRVRDRAHGRARRSRSARRTSTWLLGDAGAPAAAALRRIVEGCKVLSFRLARRRAFDPEPVIADLAAAWDEAMSRARRTSVRSTSAAWRLATCRARGRPAPTRATALDWLAAPVPGTVAGALRGAGRWRPGDRSTSTARTGGSARGCRRAAGATARSVVLRLDGIATVAEVYARRRAGARERVDVRRRTRVDARHRRRGRAHDPLPRAGAAARRARASRARAGGRGSPTARCASTARRCSAARPGSRPGPPPSGRGGRCALERRRGAVCDALALRPRLDGRRRRPDRRRVAAGRRRRGRARRARRPPPPRSTRDGTATLRVPGVARWWPHTHGEPGAARRAAARRRRASVAAPARRLPRARVRRAPETTASRLPSTASRSSSAARSGRRPTRSARLRPEPLRPALEQARDARA